MALCRPHSIFICAAVFMVSLCAPMWAREEERRIEWQPVSQEELALKDNPALPGASAMILYREVFEDDSMSYELHHDRIKIFTNEGKKYADVEITFFEKSNEITEIKGRTIRPDGSVAEFQGQVMEKTVVRARKLKLQAKVFTLPDVQKGSIIEYSYKIRWRSKAPNELTHPGDYIFAKGNYIAATHWDFQDELFVRRAHYFIRPYHNARLVWGMFASKKVQQPLTLSDGSIQLDVENVEPIQKEDYMPPEPSVKSSVDVYYVFGFPITEDAYWHQIGEWRSEVLEKFMSKSKSVDRLVDQLVSSQDSPEAKLRKLYERAQQIRFLSFEPAKTEKEAKKENIKENNNVDEVLNRGYASANQINLLFVAMARAAGFEAAPVMVTDRSASFFRRGFLNPAQLNAMVVWVKAGSKDYYLDPATRFCPFDVLPWGETQASGIRLVKNGVTFVTTPQPPSSASTKERKASLELDGEGNLQGKVHLAFHGEEALDLRIDNHEKDEAGRKKVLEDILKAELPAGSTVELKNSSSWEQTSDSFDADFEVKILSLANHTGRRLLLPTSIFHTLDKSPFQNAQRVNAVYMRYPYQDRDDVSIKIPSGFLVETLPPPRDSKEAFGHYTVSYESQPGSIHCVRQVVMDGLIFRPEDYPTLRAFYNSVRSGDGQQAIFKTAAAAQQN